jgi:hypothetical protein
MKTAHRTQAKTKRRWQADPMAALKLINKIEPFTTDEMAQVAMPARLAFEQIKSGIGSEAAFDELAFACNTATVRSESIDALCVETCLIAQRALLRCKDRYVRTGRWGFDGLALQEIPPMLDLHDDLILNSSPLQMNAAFMEQADRARRGLVNTLEGSAA